MRSDKSLDDVISNDTIGSPKLPGHDGQVRSNPDHREVFAEFATSLEQALTQLGFLAPQAVSTSDASPNARNQKARPNASPAR